MKKIILILLAICIVLPPIYAQTYQQKADVNVIIPFEVNGTTASPSATCNLTVQYPNSSYLVNNTKMTNMQTGNFNYTINHTNTKQIGEYDWTAFCCDTSSRCAVGYGSFLITVSGDDDLTAGEGISLFASLMVLIIVGIFFFILAMKWKNPFGTFALLVASIIILIIIIFYTMVIVQQTLGGFANIVSGFEAFFIIMRIAIYPLSIALGIFAILVVIRYYKFKRGLID